MVTLTFEVCVKIHVKKKIRYKKSCIIIVLNFVAVCFSVGYSGIVTDFATVGLIICFL